MKSALLVGGGIIGQFTAYYLSRQDVAVTIIDENPEMPPASAGNCGLITPSHIAPLNSWPTLLQGIRWLGKKDAPLYLKPQADPDFIKWLLSFMWNCRQTSIHKSTAARHQLLQLSWQLYSDFFEQEDSKAEWKTQGLLYACKSEKGLQEMANEVKHLQSHKLDSNILSKDELQTLEPSLKEDTVGGAIYHVDGWLNPTQLMRDLRSINESRGVKYISAITNGFETKNGTIASVNVGDGSSINADQYILCGGARSVLLAKKLGIHLPIVPGKGYNLTSTSGIKNQPTRPVYMVERKVVATPWSSGFRLGSTMEFSGYDLSLNPARLDALKRASAEYLRTELDEVDFVPWAGWRPMTSNGIPIIEPAIKYKNLTLATGHSMLGLSMAPATGKMVTEILTQ